MAKVEAERESGPVLGSSPSLQRGLKVDSEATNTLEDLKRVIKIRPSIVAIGVSLIPLALTVSIIAIMIEFLSSLAGGDLRIFVQEQMHPLVIYIKIAIILDGVRRYFNDLYVMSDKVISQKKGRLSLQYSRAAVEYKFITEVRIEQSLLGRFLRYGTIKIACAAISEHEIVMKNVAFPQKLVAWLANSRLKRETGYDEIKFSL